MPSVLNCINNSAVINYLYKYARNRKTFITLINENFKCTAVHYSTSTEYQQERAFAFSVNIPTKHAKLELLLAGVKCSD